MPAAPAPARHDCPLGAAHWCFFSGAPAAVQSPPTRWRQPSSAGQVAAGSRPLREWGRSQAQQAKAGCCHRKRRWPPVRKVKPGAAFPGPPAPLYCTLCSSALAASPGFGAALCRRVPELRRRRGCVQQEARAAPCFCPPGVWQVGEDAGFGVSSLEQSFLDTPSAVAQTRRRSA